MKDDTRVYDLVRKATPHRYRIRDELEICAVSGRKHTHKILMGGSGTRKQDIGLILSVCPNPASSRCAKHLQPLKLQMSVTSRLGLLLDLAVLHPPPFDSEDFARWCCETTVSLLARDTATLQGGVVLGPGVFAAFTANIPGLEDLPRLNEDVDAPSLSVRTRTLPTVVVADGEEVDVLLVIYEIDRIGPYRVVAKGKKLGALVGFTFRQPAVMRALGLASNSRELSAYMMYEPFQQAWTKAVRPSQTVTVCEGGGAIYRHPRVNVTLWLDSYVKHIYPDWVRQGLALRDLAAIAAENGGTAGHVTQGALEEAAPTHHGAAASGKRPVLALPAPGPSDKSKRPVLALPALGPSHKSKRPVLALPALGPSLKSKRPVLALPAPAPSDKSRRSLPALLAPPPAVKAKQPLLELPAPILKRKRTDDALPVQQAEMSSDKEIPTVANAGPATACLRSSISATAQTVIDLTASDTDSSKTRKRKRSLEFPEPLVKLTIAHKETGRRRKRQRRLRVLVKLEGKGTELEPYVL